MCALTEQVNPHLCTLIHSISKCIMMKSFVVRPGEEPLSHAVHLTDLDMTSLLVVLRSYQLVGKVSKITI